MKPDPYSRLQGFKKQAGSVFQVMGATVALNASRLDTDKSASVRNAG